MICVSSTQEKSKSQTALKQDTTVESQTYNQTEAELSKCTTTAHINYRRIDEVNTKVAKCLCARDYKGFGTGFDTMNGVIEWSK